MESAVIDPEAWDLTIVRAQGLRLMRPEKAWRPIVTVEIDKHNHHETVLGVDGQNPNLKQFFKFYDVQSASTLEMKVWYRSQSKKKSKKRVLVASATHSLGDLLKRVEFEGTGKPAKGDLLDIRLSCQLPSKRSSSSSGKGKPQNGASLTIKLTPPRVHSRQAQSPTQEEANQHSRAMEEVGYSSEGSSSSSSSHPAPSISSSSQLSASESKTLIGVQPPSPTHSEARPIPSPPGLRRRKKRKRIKGFFSDDDVISCTASEAESDSYSRSDSASASGSFNSSTSFFGSAALRGDLPLEEMSFESFDDIDEIMVSNSPTTISLVPRASVEAEKTTKTKTTTTTTETTVNERTSIRSWIAGSLLPQHVLAHKPLNASSDSLSKEEVPPYTETDITTVGAGGSASIVPHSPVEPEVKTPTKNVWWEQFLGNFTFYLDLRDAQVDSQFEVVLQNLRMEWTFMGGFLAALGAVDVAVLAIDADDSIIPINPLSLRAIALSSTFTGLGITTLAYFILRYSLSPPHLFRVRAQDVYGSYIFFALSARVPTLCMVASAMTLLGFLAVVAFEVWPVGVVVGCFLVGMLMSLQFLVYGCHMFVRGVIGAVRGVVGLVRRVVLRTAAEASGNGTPQLSSGGRSEGASRLRVKLAKMKATKPTAGTSV